MKHLVFPLALGILIVLAAARPAEAATTLILDGPTSVRPDTDVTYALRASLTEPVNALAMTVAGEPAAVGAIGFSAGDSVIRSWLERSVASASVRLEGIIPGGVVPGTGDTVPIGYLTLKFTRLGRTTLAVRDPEVYLNLSVPTRDRVNADQLTITVSAEAPEAAGSPPMAEEGAYVTVFHAQEFLGGAWSLAYDIRTSSGPVATALIRERFLGLFGGWREISSPASLSDQSRLSIVDVGIPTDSGVRIVYREVPVRLIALAALLGAAAIAFVAYRRMKR